MATIQPITKFDKELREIVTGVLQKTEHPDLIPSYKEVTSHLDSAGITFSATVNNLADLMFNAQNSSTRLRATKLALDMRKIDRNQDKMDATLTVNFNFESGSEAKVQSIFNPRS